MLLLLLGEVLNLKTVLVFCSNPVNGGTAEVFVTMCQEIKSKNLPDMKVIPAIDMSNDVKVYSGLCDIVKLDVKSEATALGERNNNCNVFARLVQKIGRRLKYSKFIKHNKSVIIEFLKKEKVDIVVVHNGGYYGDELCNQVIFAAKEVNTVEKRIVVFHNDFEKSFIDKTRFLCYDYLINKYATDVITVSQYTKNRIENNSFLKKNIQVVYNGIKVSRTMTIQEKKSTINFTSNKVNIAMVGNFIPRKGQLFLLKALTKLENDKEVKQKVRVTFFGNIYDKQYHEQCVNYIENNHLGEMVSVFHGIFNAKEYLDIFDFSVVPSLYDESFGLIAAESMANGTPVVAFACGGIPEVVKHNVNGLLVPIGDEHKLYLAIKHLVENPERLNELSQQSKSYYNRMFSSEAMANKYLEVIND